MLQIPSYSKRLRFVAVACLFAVVASIAAVNLRAADRDDARALFIQQDAVQAFDLATGKGFQIGTATGELAGTTFVDFTFTPAGPPAGDVLPITFQNKVIITDLDGDQIFFDNNGTGSFHLGFGPDFRGSGGPLAGTYVVTGGTGKFSRWKVGAKFNYHAVATNPPTPPGGFGNVYVEVSRRAGNH